jgi:Protein of unknown function (DUF1569)
MKTLASARDKAEIVQRLALINPTSRRRWGTMTVGQMLCHLSDAYRVALGDRQAKAVRNRYNGPLMRWMALWLPLPWPPGVPTVPECDANAGGTPPADFEDDKRELLTLLERFAAQPNEAEQHAHPFFGQMTGKEWMRWGYLHADHHLRQFSA